MTSVAEDSRLGTDSKIGNYRIVRVIGEGGMGVVYEGVHESLGKRVAIKTLLAMRSKNQEVIERFVREGKAIAKIQHPNVVDVFDVAVHEGSPYLVMEYLEGQDLGARMENEAPMSVQAIADMMIPVVSALAAAHDVGIVHRDLKPENIFVTKTKSGSPEPKLVDFGISKVHDKDAMHLTSTHAMLGTPYYMSPEQAGSAKKVDHRSDIFSLGVILYQCATHELPFKGDSLYELLGAIMTIEPPAPRSLVGVMPAGFEAVISRAMRKDPAERFQSAVELGKALLPFASPRTKLGYEGEFGGPVPFGTPEPVVLPPTERPPPPVKKATAAPPKWLWASPSLLVVAAASGWMMLRGGNKDAHDVRTDPQASVVPPSASAATPATAAKSEPTEAATAHDEPAPPAAPSAPPSAVAKAEPQPVAAAHRPGKRPPERPAASTKAPVEAPRPAVTPPPAPVAKPAEPAAPPAGRDLFLDRK